MTLTAGVVIDQRFVIGRVLRESDVARVYEATDRGGDDVWLAVPRASEHAPALAAFERAANALRSLAVSARERGVTGDGRPFLVLAPVSGQRADHWVQHCGGRAPSAEAMGIGDALCQALARLHDAGVSLGVLRTESIVVLTRGGMCLVELEHTRPLTDASRAEDLALVGRVLYEMLAGRPFAADAPALSVLAPELPRAMTITVDAAARGRYASIDELRAALARSVPQWLGPVRRPMPSMSPDVEASFELSEIVLPRSSKMLFDPGALVDSSPRLPEAASDSQPSGGFDLGSSARGRSSTAGLAAPSLESTPPPPPARASLRSRIVAGAIGSAAAFATIAAMLLVSGRFAGESALPSANVVHAPVLSEAAAATEALAASEPAPSAAAFASAVPGASEAAVASAATVASAAAAASAAPVGETTFRFEGDRLPRYVIIDGVTVGTTNHVVRHRCGPHAVKIGGKGATRSIELPCGGEQTIVIERNGKWRAP